MSEAVGSRAFLPNRRPLWTDTLQWAGATWLLGVGFDPQDGIAREIWLNPADTEAAIDSEIIILIHHACIASSWLLQSGTTAKDCARRLTSNSPSLLSLAMGRAAEMQDELGERIREFHRQREAH